MILIADSGSTKCSWALCNEKGEIINRYHTAGFNPKFNSYDSILKEMNESSLSAIKEMVTEVYFYGAGCSTEKKIK